MTDEAEIAAWVAQAPEVRPDWFRHESRLHGVGHTRRVHVLAGRLAALEAWDEADTRLALRAALLHDIGRTHDGWDPRHGASSATQAEGLGLLGGLERHETGLVLFAVTYHSRSDRRARGEAAAWCARRAREGGDTDGPPDPDRALRILWLLKDADALDRVRLPAFEHADPRFFRYRRTADLMEFAERLYAALGP